MSAYSLARLMLCAMLFLFPARAELAPAAPDANPSEAEQAERRHSDQLYRDAQRELDRQDDARALALLLEYLDFTKANAHRPERVFWAIDQVGHIYLGRKRDPDGALAFFQKLEGDARLSDLDRAAVAEWISVATEWKQTRGELATGLRDANHLMDRSRRYFNGGLRKADKMGGTMFANADFHIAEGYLRRFVILHDRDARIGDALYMLGAIRHHTRPDPDHWSDNFYLKEVIRRLPHTEQAHKAYELLSQDVTQAYRPQAVPGDLAQQLQLYRELAQPHVAAPPSGR